MSSSSFRAASNIYLYILCRAAQLPFHCIFNGFQFVCVKTPSLRCHGSYFICTGCVQQEEFLRLSIQTRFQFGCQTQASCSLIFSLFPLAGDAVVLYVGTARALPHNWRSKRNIFFFLPSHFFFLFLRSFSPHPSWRPGIYISIYNCYGAIFNSMANTSTHTQ